MSEVRIAIPEFKVCGKCQAEKAASEFWQCTYKDGVTRLQSYCKSCGAAANRENFIIKNTERKNNIILLPLTDKKCGKCNEVKPISSFMFKKWNTKHTKKYYASYCKPCALENKKEWDRNHPEKASISRKKNMQRVREAGVCSELYAMKKLRELRSKSKRLNLPFNLEMRDLIVPEYCPVLGIKLAFNPGQPKWDSASCDRIVPSKGYVKGNVIIVSNLANTIKSVATIEQLKAVSDFYCKLEKDNGGVL